MHLSPFRHFNFNIDETVNYIYLTVVLNLIVTYFCDYKFKSWHLLKFYPTFLTFYKSIFFFAWRDKTDVLYSIFFFLFRVNMYSNYSHCTGVIYFHFYFFVSLIFHQQLENNRIMLTKKWKFREN